MPQGHVDRRRGRRVPVGALVRIRRIDGKPSDPIAEQTTKNVSLAGVYFETDQPVSLKIDDVVLASVSIPDTKTREFPFTRLSGRGRIVRVEPLQLEGSGARAGHGIALEFGDDLTALSAIPARG